MGDRCGRSLGRGDLVLGDGMKKQPLPRTVVLRTVLDALNREIRDVQKRDWTGGGRWPHMKEEQARYIQGVRESVGIVRAVARRTRSTE